MNHTNKVGERLEEILDMYANWLDLFDDETPGLNKVGAKAAILALFKSIMPEKTNWEYRTSDEDKAWAEGFDACRTELLKLLED